jgi:hypothetical protein
VGGALFQRSMARRFPFTTAYERYLNRRAEKLDEM